MTHCLPPRNPFITQRLWEVHKDPAALESVLELLGRQRGACDEVWFSSEYGFPPLGVHRNCAEKMGVAAGRVRRLGIGASLQISNTLGHGEYLAHLDFSGIQWQRMVGADGVEAPVCNCPRDPAFLEYLAESTKAYCAWQPDSVWIDDDLRISNHGRVAHGCFCHGCLAAFEKFFDTPTRRHADASEKRQALIQALNDNASIETRRAWLDFNRAALANVAATIARAAISVAPNCRLGLQHADPRWGFNGPDFAPVFEALAAATGRPVGSRPGGGFYDDHAPRGAYHKALFAALQKSRLPACVDDVREEVENFPGTFHGKSANGTAVEATFALAHGCDALTFTPLMFLQEELSWQEKVLATLAEWRPFWERYLVASEGTRPVGAEIAFGKSSVFRELQSGERDFAWAYTHLDDVAKLAPLGVPLAWECGGDAPVLLHSYASDGLTDVEIRALFSRNVLTDGDTLLRLQERGLADGLPVFAEALAVKARHERFTEDALNGGNAGKTMGVISLGGARQVGVWPGRARPPGAPQGHAVANGTRMTRMERIDTDKIRANPFNPCHPCSPCHSVPQA